MGIQAYWTTEHVAEAVVVAAQEEKREQPRNAAGNFLLDFLFGHPSVSGWALKSSVS